MYLWLATFFVWILIAWKLPILLQNWSGGGGVKLYKGEMYSERHENV